MKKRFWSMLLVLCMALALLPVSALAAESSGSCGANVTWKLSSAGVLTISGTGDMADYYLFSQVPWYDTRDSITSVVIKSGVTSVGDDAFVECENLETVTLPSSVTRIGDNAFFHCYGLRSLTIPATVQSIGGSAFAECSSLKNITIPQGVPEIGDWTFYHCRQLQSINIPDSVTSIGYEAFASCTFMGDVSIPASVTFIDDNAFYDCYSMEAINVASSNPSFASSDGVLFDKAKTTLIQCPGGKDGAYAMPSTVKTITAGAFSRCHAITSVRMSSRVTEISASAFAYCDNLQRILIPKGVATIKSYAFEGCRTLEDVYYSGAASDWSSIQIDSHNDPLDTAEIHYNFSSASITTQPKNAAVSGSNYATFTVKAAGEGLRYQWQYQKPSGSWTNCTSATQGYNTATLKVQGVTGSTNRNGYQYRCKVTDVMGSTVTSSAATLTVNTLKITTQPKAANVKTTAYATFKVAASGDGLKYQWQYKKPGGSWTNCTSATQGYNTATLKVQGVTDGTNRNGYQYRCIVTDSSGAKVTSSVAKLSVLAITTQPKAASISKTGTATFTAKATGDGLKYQWQFKTPSGDWKNCTSATTGYNTATLKVKGASGSTNRNGYQYRCVITDGAGNKLTTSAVKLTVK